MSQEGDNVMEYAAQRFATETPTETPAAEIVADKPADTSTETPDSTAIVDDKTNVAAETVIPTAEVAVDYSKFLSDTSEGLFTDVDSFKLALPKIKEYDTLLTTKTELEEKLKVDPFANDYVKTLNEMVRTGKSADEIENFTKISRLNIDELSPVDAKVMVMVKNGYDAKIAKEIVEEDFPIEDYEPGTPERARLEEKLRVSSLEDRKILKEFKKDLTTVDNSAAVQAETNRLQLIADAENHKKSVKQIIPTISEKISGLGEKNLNGKEGDQAVKLNFDYNAEFKSQLPVKLESFFLDGRMEVNDENVALAEKYIRADYLEKNFDTIAQSIFKHAEALTEERMVNKYENRTGLPPESTNVIVDNSQKEYSDFLTKVATGR